MRSELNLHQLSTAYVGSLFELTNKDDVSQEEVEAIIGRYKEIFRAMPLKEQKSWLYMFLCNDNAGHLCRTFPDLLSVVVSEIMPSIGFDHQHPSHPHDVWTHTTYVVEGTLPGLSVRLAALFHDLGKPETFRMVEERNVGLCPGHAKALADIAEAVLSRLGSSDGRIREVYNMVLYHDDIFPIERKTVLEMTERFSRRNIPGFLSLRTSDLYAHSLDYIQRRLSREQELQRFVRERI